MSDANSAPDPLFLERTTALVARRLLKADSDTLDSAITLTLQDLGQCIGADRSYLFLFHANGTHVYNSHEWCEDGIEAHMDALQNVLFDRSTFLAQQMLAGKTVDIPLLSEHTFATPQEKALLQAQGIQSIILAPLFQRGHLQGFVGFDAVRQARRWKEQDIALLELAVDGMGHALARRQQELALRASEDRLQNLFNRLPRISVQGYDEDRRVIFWNQASQDLYGYTAAEALGQKLEDLIIPDFMRDLVIEAHRQWLQEGIEIPADELTLRRKDGSEVPVFSSHLLQRTLGGQVEMYCVDIDLTEQKKAAAALEFLASHDALTGLPNRRLLHDRLGQALQQCQRNGHIVAVAYIDLDGFKAVNDSHGHAIGDELLCQLTSRMQASMRGTDTLARLGGDEFVAVLASLPDESAAVPLLERLLQIVGQPLACGALTLQTTASIGVSFGSAHTPIDADALLRQADLAMYQAKLLGKNRYAFFDTRLDQSLRLQHEQETRFAEALERNELALYFQPQVNLRTGQVLGLEALLRWVHPQRGLLAPGEFLPHIQRQDLWVALGEWVIANALEKLSTWHHAGFQFRVSINVAGEHVQHPSFLQRLEQLLRARPDLPPQSVVLELLESSTLGSLEKVAEVIHACHTLGVEVALDDFGTGYSSLAYLKQLPVDMIKIDRSFVRELLQDERDLTILKGILLLARGCGHAVLAEGVESSEQAEMLLQVGCEQAQGYAIARPMPAEEVANWVREWSGRWESNPRLELGKLRSCH